MSFHPVVLPLPPPPSLPSPSHLSLFPSPFFHVPPMSKLGHVGPPLTLPSTAAIPPPPLSTKPTLPPPAAPPTTKPTPPPTKHTLTPVKNQRPTKRMRTRIDQIVADVAQRLISSASPAPVSASPAPVSASPAPAPQPIEHCTSCGDRFTSKRKPTAYNKCFDCISGHDLTTWKQRGKGTVRACKLCHFVGATGTFFPDICQAKVSTVPEKTYTCTHCNEQMSQSKLKTHVFNHKRDLNKKKTTTKVMFPETSTTKFYFVDSQPESESVIYNVKTSSSGVIPHLARSLLRMTTLSPSSPLSVDKVSVAITDALKIDMKDVDVRSMLDETSEILDSWSHFDKDRNEIRGRSMDGRVRHAVCQHMRNAQRSITDLPRGSPGHNKAKFKFASMHRFLNGSVYHFNRGGSKNIQGITDSSDLIPLGRYGDFAVQPVNYKSALDGVKNFIETM